MFDKSNSVRPAERDFERGVAFIGARRFLQISLISLT